MGSRIKIIRIGNSQGIRLNKEILQQIKAEIGATIEISTFPDPKDKNATIWGFKVVDNA